MLQTLPSAPPPAPSFPAAVEESEEDRARRYIDAAKACGLVIFPWPCGGRLGNMVGLTGRDIDGPDDYSAGSHRLSLHPDREAADGCREGLVFDLLCADFGVDPNDPEFHAKVNASIIADLQSVAS